MENFLTGSEILQDPTLINQISDSTYFIETVILYFIVLITVLTFLVIKKNYRENVKLIFKNILLLYKNFIHWNISKIIIIFYSIITGFILSIPFGALSLYLIYRVFSGLSATSINLFLINQSLNEELLSAIMGSIWIILIIIILLAIIASIFIFTFTYGYFLLQNVYKSYLEGKKLGYTKNLYFSKKYLWKYLGTLSWVALYMLIPIGISLVMTIILMILSYFGIINENMNNAGNLVLGGVTLATFICLLAFFVYLGVRLAFSYIALLYTKKTENKTKKYIDESFKISKGKVIQIIGLILPILLITFLFSTIKDNLPDNQILFTIYSIIVFLFVEGISYMGYISIYLILKKDKN